MRLSVVLLFSAFLAQSRSFAQTTEPPPASARELQSLKGWSEGQDQVDALLRRREASDYTDDWKTLHEDGGWFGRTTAERADAVIGVLTTGKLRDVRRQLRDIQADIQTRRDKIRDYRFAEIGKPGDGAAGASTKPIDAEEQAIQADQARAQDLNGAFSADLREAGVDLSEAQLSSLLSVTSGDDLSQILELFASLRSVSDALERSTIRSSEDAGVAKRYYEVYAVLLDTALYSQVRFVHKIDEVWIPRIDVVTADTRKVRAETDVLLQTASAANRPVLLANRKAQGMTLQTADLYRRCLLDQRRAAADTARKLSEQRNVALNTFKTVAESLDLVGLIRTSNGQSQKLLEVDIPPLRPFESQQMQQEFDKLSGQIGKPAS